MMGARTRAAVAVAAAGLIGLMIAGCGAGQDARTSLNLSSVPGVNVNADDDSILVRNAHVPFNEAGYPAGDAVPVELWLFNQTNAPVRLVGVGSDGPGSAATVETEGEIEVPPGGPVHIVLRATGPGLDFNPIDILPLTLIFDNGVELSMRVPMAPPLAPLPRTPMDLGEEH